jgi:hypothetical protein
VLPAQPIFTLKNSEHFDLGRVANKVLMGCTESLTERIMNGVRLHEGEGVTGGGGGNWCRAVGYERRCTGGLVGTAVETDGRTDRHVGTINFKLITI